MGYRNASARHHMRQRAMRDRKALQYQKQRAGEYVRRDIFRPPYRRCSVRRRHTGVKNLYFRIINMFGKPVGGDKKAVVSGISIVT